jgi:hypothetical protein
MAIGQFCRHQRRTFWPILGAREDVAFFIFTFLFLAAVGGCYHWAQPSSHEGDVH